MPMSEENAGNSAREKVNAAKRLHALLVELRSMGGPNLLTLLPMTLGVTTESHQIEPTLAAMQSLGILAQMIFDVQLEISESRMDIEEHAHYMKFVPTVCTALSPVYFAHNWAEIRAKITDVDLTLIASLDLALRRHVQERKIEANEFDEILEAVNQALEVLNESELPSNVKDFISDQLIGVKVAIDRYKCRGVRGIQEAIAGYGGSLAMYKPVIQEKVSDQGKSRLMDVINFGNALFTLARGAAWAWPHLAATIEIIKPLLN